MFSGGSVTTDKFVPDSDIDLFVEIDNKDPISYSNKYFNLKNQLKKNYNLKSKLNLTILFKNFVSWIYMINLAELSRK